MHRPNVVGAAEQGGEARLATFKSLLQDRAISIAEDLESGQRYKRTVLRHLWPKSEGPGRICDRSKENDALSDFDKIEIQALRSFVRAAFHQGPLVLGEFYENVTRAEQPYANLIATMLAARSEVNGRVFLTNADGHTIADALERTGRSLLSAGFCRFAERAFDQAADLHARFRNTGAEDRCRYMMLDARRRTYSWRYPIRSGLELSRWLFGYGYKPMRLVIWITVAISGFAVYLLHLPRDPGATRSDAIFMTLQNFVNPMSLGDVKSISPGWETPLEMETYTGDVLRNVFFVLIIRKWFRL